MKMSLIKTEHRALFFNFDKNPWTKSTFILRHCRRLQIGFGSFVFPLDVNNSALLSWHSYWPLSFLLPFIWIKGNKFSSLFLTGKSDEASSCPNVSLYWQWLNNHIWDFLYIFNKVTISRMFTSQLCQAYSNIRHLPFSRMSFYEQIYYICFWYYSFVQACQMSSLPSGEMYYVLSLCHYIH